MADPSANAGELPLGLQVISRQLDEAEEKARRIIDGISNTQGSWQPREGAWSIVQCLDHLGRTNTVYAAALREALNNAKQVRGAMTGFIQPGCPSRIMIRLLEPPPMGKMRAPKKIVPATQVNKDDSLRSFLHSHNEVRAVMHQGAWVDLNRIRFRNPFVSSLRFTVGAGLLIIAAHDRRHLWQADQVRQSAGFPQSSSIAMTN
jgi:DinB superfamily